MTSQEIQSREKQTVEHEGTRPGWVFRPEVDIVEGPEDYRITADLPGANDSTVRVQLEDGLLSIDAHRVSEPEAGWQPLFTEYRVGGFHRKFRVGDSVDAEAIAARMHDGVLELRLPKVKQPGPHRIEVQSG